MNVMYMAMKMLTFDVPFVHDYTLHASVFSPLSTVGCADILCTLHISIRKPFPFYGMYYELVSRRIVYYITIA